MMKINILNDNKAKLLMIISSLLFAIMASFVKVSSHTVAIKALFRQIISCICVIHIIFLYNIRIIPLKKNRIKLLLRCLFGSVGIYLYFYSIDNLLLANASMLTRLSPFFVTLFAFLLLKESINRLNWLIFIPMVIGCVFIIKPNSNLFHLASIFAVLSAISGALAYTMIKSIGRDESAYTIIFWFTLISSILYSLIAGKQLLRLNNIEYLNLIMIGIFGVLGQIGLTLSYQLSKASNVAPYSYFYIIFSGLMGYHIWNEIPDILSIFGYGLIIISYYFLMRLNSK
jgi:drug/metabolite transporter (DMT)-like permease